MLAPTPGRGMNRLIWDAVLRERAVRASPGRPSALSRSRSNSVLCGAFVWARRGLNSHKWWDLARAVRVLSDRVRGRPRAPLSRRAW
jgi:hypothetical protein